MLSVQPDAVLCGLCARGNDDAFAVLHARYRQQLFAFVYHLLGPPASADDAEDLTQEIFQKAYSNMGTRNSDGSFKAWLFRIARNHTFDHIRARKPRAVSLDDPDVAVEPSNVVSLHTQVERRAEFSWLLAAMGALPDRQREALVLRELGGASIDEIAGALGTTPESAKQLVKRGRAALSEAATQSGYRSRKLGRELAAAAPIAAFGWLGAGKASAAVAASGATVGAAGGAAAGGAAAGGVAAAGVGGTASVLAAGKLAAVVLAATAIGTGGVVVGEKVADSNGGEPAAVKTDGSSGGPAVPANSLTVGDKASEQAVLNKQAANARRERARERAAERRKVARAHRKAKAERAAKAKARAHADGKGNSQGSSHSGTRGSSNSSGGSGGSSKSQSNAPSSSGGQGGGSAGGSGSGGSSTNGSGGSSGGANSGGGSGGRGGGKPTE